MLCLWIHPECETHWRLCRRRSLAYTPNTRLCHAGGCRELESKLKEHGKSADAHYPGLITVLQRHEIRSVNEAAAKDAWARVMDFYREHLSD